MSEIRQNFHEECEDAINKQINMELYASYVYLSMSYHFSRTDVALPGAHKYFLNASSDEREHAMKLMAYQNSRGGRLLLTDVKAPPNQDWGKLEDAMAHALALEKDVNESLLALHSLGSRHNDPNLLDFLETHYLQEQVDSISEIGGHLTNLRRNGDGVGEFLYDKELSHE